MFSSSFICIVVFFPFSLTFQTDSILSNFDFDFWHGNSLSEFRNIYTQITRDQSCLLLARRPEWKRQVCLLAVQTYSYILVYVTAVSLLKTRITVAAAPCLQVKWSYKVLHLTHLFSSVSSSQILTNPLPPVSSPPPASKSKEVSDGENLEVSKKLSKIRIQEGRPVSRHSVLIFKTLAWLAN